MFLSPAGKEEIAIPQYSSTAEAAEAHPLADVFINFSSFRSAYESSMEALRLGTIRVVAIIAEGIPERDTKVRAAHRGICSRSPAPSPPAAAEEQRLALELLLTTPWAPLPRCRR